MNKEAIPYRCQACPVILPLLDQENYWENRQVTPDVRAKLEAWGFNERQIDVTALENYEGLEKVRRQLAEAAVRTVGCTGARIIVLDPETQSSAGKEILCMSPDETIG